MSDEELESIKARLSKLEAVLTQGRSLGPGGARRAGAPLAGPRRERPGLSVKCKCGKNDFEVPLGAFLDGRPRTWIADVTCGCGEITFATIDPVEAAKRVDENPPEPSAFLAGFPPRLPEPPTRE